MSLPVGVPVLGVPPPMALRPSSSLNPKFSNLSADFPPLPAPKFGYPATQNPSTFDNHLLVQAESSPSLETKGAEKTKSSYANLARNRNAQRPKVRFPPRKHNFLNGKPVVSFSNAENELLAQTCKWTIIGKFSHIRPCINIIRREFAKIIPGKGTIRIGAFDMHHVFLDFDNLEDHLNVLSRNFIQLGGLNIMKIIKWSTKFKPDADNTLAPVWINLPDLKWHLYEWDAICRIVAPIGTPFLLDKATLAKTRPTTAKVRVEIDLTKPLINEVLLEITNVAGITEVINQRVEYETIPAFCSHCKLQGYQDENCRKLHPELRDMEGGTLVREQKIELQPIIGESTVDNKDAMETPSQDINSSQSKDDEWQLVVRKKGKSSSKPTTNEGTSQAPQRKDNGSNKDKKQNQFLNIRKLEVNTNEQKLQAEGVNNIDTTTIMQIM
ncbi:hypothetical protein H5410_031214 [Solanum commersonii]|uniref:DUF4283 domain-containing protein n=1 Tax=Solanum commersonii TaxID=4109 RepID=A0A9J5YL13_SOLCO|nr:hypothetical protein H5410_031214 [Solanum commersonii]